MIKEFIQSLFHKREDSLMEEDISYESMECAWEDVDLNVEEERTRLVTDYLERAKDTQQELELLEEEYDKVTGYLADIEILAELPEEEKKILEGIVSSLMELTREYQKYLDKEDRMDDAIYYRLRAQAAELKEAVEKILEAEDQAGKIKQDLKKLDREKQAYLYRGKELEKMMANYKGMAIIFIGALAVCILALLIMQFAFQMDTLVGYFGGVVSFAVAMTVLAVKYMDTEKELKKVVKARKRLARITNTVKVRYVNNTNLLSYYYLKYHTESGKKLEKDYQKYLQEAEERRQFAETEDRRERQQDKLYAKLVDYQMHFPMRLSARPECILNKKEQVEQRHSLILRRQSLRKQIEYHRNIFETVQGEVKELMRLYPQYANEITDMVDKYGIKSFL